VCGVSFFGLLLACFVSVWCFFLWWWIFVWVLAVCLWGLYVSVLCCVSLIVGCECVVGWPGCVLDGFVRVCLC